MDRNHHISQIASRVFPDLSEFYKHKAERLERQYLDLRQLLEQVQISFDRSREAFTTTDALVTELSQLQAATSDLQVFLFREREENLRLAAENDKLLIKEWEAIRKVQVLLKLSGISQQKLLNALNKDSVENLNSQRSTSLDKNECLSKDGSMAEMKSLKTQLENLKTLYRNEVDVLLKDREVVAEERVVEFHRLQSELDLLSCNLKMSKDALCEVTQKLIVAEIEREQERFDYIDTQIELEKQLKLVNAQRGPAFSTSARMNIRHLQQEIEERTEVIGSVQQKAKRLEGELAKWKMRAENTEAALKDKTQKMTSDMALLRRRYDQLDRRRHLEADGLQADIKILRERVKNLEKVIAKMKADNVKNDESEDQDLKSSTHRTLLRAKELERELGSLRCKVVALTDERLQ